MLLEPSGGVSMSLRIRGFVVIVHSIILLFLPLAVFAADFGAEITDIDGKVYVTQKSTGKKIPAMRGLKVAPGDVIESASGGEAEILYDDGNVTRLDENTRLEISKLSIEPDNSRESVLNLVSGRIKNSVSKLVTKKSKFEVSSKTVTAGVTGTPPWIVSIVGGKNQTDPVKTEIDLLKGEKGGVFVRGTDPKGSTIILTPGSRTIAQLGMPPMNPFPISAERLKELQTKMPIITPPAVRQKKRKQLDTKPVEISKGKQEEKKDESKEAAKKDEGKESEEPAKGNANNDSAASPNSGGSATADTVDSGVVGAANAGPVSVDSSAVAANSAPITEKAVGSGMVMDYMTHIVSVAPVAVPSNDSPSGQDPTGVSTETQVAQGVNALAGASTSAVASTTRVRVQVGIAYK